MGFAELFEGCAGLGPAKERFHVLVVGQAEHGGAVALGVFIPRERRDAKKRRLFGGGWKTYFESLR
jgi:hypothetical protein